MARKPKAPIAANDDRLKLLEALRFAAIAIDKKEDKFSYVCIRDGWLSADNETFSIGIQVDVALDLCPQADLFAAALNQCAEQFQLTQVDLHSVSIRSGKFNALVPVLVTDETGEFNPDEPCAFINDALKDAFAASLRCMGKGEKIYHNAVLLRSNTTCATNAGIALEYWHGIDLPGPLNIPKKTAETIVKIDKPLAQFGFSADSVTFYFDDMSFIKTRLVQGEFPNLEKLFAANSGPLVPIWPEFFAGIKAVEKFVQNDVVHLHSEHIATHHTLALGASYKVPGLPSGYAFSAIYWKAIEPFVKAVRFATKNEPVVFAGDNARGLIIGKHV